MKRRTTLYRDGLIFLSVMLVIFLGAVVRQVNLLLLFASIMVSFVVFDFLLGRRLLRGLTARRIAPSSPSAGEPFAAVIELSNRRKRGTSWGVVVEETVTPDFTEWRLLDALPAGGPAIPLSDEEKGTRKKRRFFRLMPEKTNHRFRPACYFEEIRPGASVRKTWAGRLPLRGWYQLGPITISTRFPLGFFRSSVTFPETAGFLVRPKLGRIDPAWLDRLREQREQESRFRSRLSRTGDEMFGVRDWQTGDARKWVHWRSSAKYQKIMVRQYQERNHQEAAVLLDLFHPDALTLETLEYRELAVSFAASLCAELSRKGGREVLLGLVGKLTHIPGLESLAEEEPALIQTGQGSAGISAIQDRLARAVETQTDSLEQTLTELIARKRPALSLVIVTMRPLDLSEKRLPNLIGDPRWQRLLAHTVTVDLSDRATEKLFVIEKGKLKMEN